MANIVALIADNHFIYTKDGGVYVNGTYTKQYLSRFTSNFDKVIVIARGRQQDFSDDLMKLRESGGDGVTFEFLDDFKGISEYIRKKRNIRKQINNVLNNVDAIFVRMPCILTTVALSSAQKKNIPIMIDIGADPETIYEGVSNKFITFLLSKYLKYVCKQSCLKANGVSYVTQKILQNKYPCTALVKGVSTNYFTASISNVDISHDFFYEDREYMNLYNNVKLLHISNNIPQKSGKGHIEALEVLGNLRKQGIKAELTFLGDGEGVSYLKEFAKQLGVLEYVSFIGRVADRHDYRNYMLNADIFIFPSHSEGLPRVLLEAMATGLVCVTSNVDGIPEIIDANDIFAYDDIKGMASRIIHIINDVEQANQISKRNLEISKRYSHENMKFIYNEYYGKVRRLIRLRNN